MSPEFIVMIKTKRHSSINEFLILPCVLFKAALSWSFSWSTGSIHVKTIPTNRHSIDRISPISADRFMATTLTTIIKILEYIRTSAQDLIRSFLGVKTFRKKPHDATAQPLVYPLIIKPSSHKNEGSKKKGIVAIRHMPIPATITFLATTCVFTYKPQVSRPKKWRIIAANI